MPTTNSPWDLKGLEIRRAKFHVLAADPSLAASDAGRFWFHSGDGLHKGWDGNKLVRLTNLLEAVVGSGALKATAIDATKTITLSVDAASSSGPGTLSVAHFNLLSGATSAKTPNTLALRDGSGAIAADVTGTASNATTVGGASLAQVRDFSLTTGTRDRTAINDFDTGVRATRLDQLTAPTAPVSIGNQRLTSVLDPQAPQDAATKAYVDSVATGLDTKASVRTATTAALPSATYANGSNGVGATLTASANGSLGTVGNVSVVAGDRVLVKDQASPQQNGIYTVTQVGSGSTPWVLTRATDADTGTKLNAGAYTFIEEGTLVGSGWVMNAPNVVTMGTTSLPWAQFTGGQSYSPGDGLALSGSTFRVLGTAGRITVSGTGVDIASTYVGQTSITTLGTIGTGTWQGTAVGVAYGGTGATTAAAARANLGTVTKYTADLPAIAAGGSTTVAHNLGTAAILAPTFTNKSTGEPEGFDVTGITATQFTVSSAIAVAAGAYTVTAIG